jgi:hypothetical protein
MTKAARAWAAFGASGEPDDALCSADAAPSQVPVVSEAAAAWERFCFIATAKRWAVDLTLSGRTRCTKAGSVVFGPGHGASIAAYRELIDQLEHADAYLAACRAGRRP